MKSAKSERLRNIGQWLRNIGEWLRKVGEWLRKDGERLRKVGEPLRKVGEWLRKVGEWLRKVGERLRKVGEPPLFQDFKPNKASDPNLIPIFLTPKRFIILLWYRPFWGGAIKGWLLVKGLAQIITYYLYFCSIKILLQAIIMMKESRCKMKHTKVE